ATARLPRSPARPSRASPGPRELSSSRVGPSLSTSGRRTVGESPTRPHAVPGLTELYGGPTAARAAMSHPTLWYFGYGSNMSRSIFCERRGMRPLATRWGWLEGYRLCFNLPIGPGERGVANLEPEAGARTCGVLYLLTP